jgi:rubredoxin
LPCLPDLHLLLIAISQSPQDGVSFQSWQLMGSREASDQSCDLIQRGILMDKYACIPCGYIYDPAEGDPDGGIPKGTPFEELPEDWVCPVCSAAKDQFEKVD